MPAARNRYIYANSKLIQLPSSIMSMLSRNEDLPYLPPILWREFREPADRSSADESVYEFFARRFTPEVAEIYARAMVHGIYAGDAEELSMKWCFPTIWNMEKKYGNVVGGMLKSSFKVSKAEQESKHRLKAKYPSLWKKVKNAGIYSFVDGMETLPNAILQDLKAYENIEFRNKRCTRLRYNEKKDKMEVNG